MTTLSMLGQIADTAMLMRQSRLFLPIKFAEAVVFESRMRPAEYRALDAEHKAAIDHCQCVVNSNQCDKCGNRGDGCPAIYLCRSATH